MANDLTGDFDVVAEFAIGTVNRVLAAMHRNQRFYHSLTFRVDDIPHGPGIPTFPVVGSLSATGNATVNQTLVGNPFPVSGEGGGSGQLARLGAVVNASVIGNGMAPVIPSQLRGIAQLQVSPPTIQIVDSAGTTVAVSMQIMSRYFPDPGSPRLAEFIRGELKLTAPVAQIASQTANVIELGIKAETLGISFTPAWSTQPVSASDIAAINLLIRNALKASFLPSNVTLPSNIADMQFKVLGGAQSAVAVLLNMQGAAGNPGSMNNYLLSGTDDFVIAVSNDFIQTTFQQIVSKILSNPLTPITVSKKILWHTFSATYSLTLNAVTLTLQTGKILLTINGHAHTPASWAPDFDFTVQQDITLQPSGDTAFMVLGNMSFDSSSWIVNLVKGSVLSGIAQARDQALTESNAQITVESALSANTSLGGFLNSLLGRWFKGVIVIPGDRLAYTSVNIQPSGIVLHGSLSVTDWPAVDVEFEKIPARAAPGLGGVIGPTFGGPDYSALNSWIPGGTIHEFDWSTLGQPQPFWIDQNKFVYVPPPPEVALAATVASAPAKTAIFGYHPICLTVRGTRLTASGPVVAQAVSGTGCGFTFHPVLGGATLGLQGAQPPLVALSQPGPNGTVQVTGHTLAGMDSSGRNTPNLIVHFADAKSAGNLKALADALTASKRKDAATAILAILPPGQIEKTPYTEGIIYAEDQGGAWAPLFRLKSTRSPLTLVMSPKGDFLWLQQGPINGSALAESLAKVLVKCDPPRLDVLRSRVSVGQQPPNFLFEYEAGHSLTLNKVTAKQTMLAFWTSKSPASIDALRDLQKTSGSPGAPLVLAINDGEDAALAKKVFDENKLSSILVTDPRREISSAYGVNVWPTTVFIDASGVVRGVRYGLLTHAMTQATTRAVPSGKSTGAESKSE